jgi:alanyl-tRNA synthetase
LARGFTSRFVGYESLSSEARVTAIVKGGREVSSAQAGDAVEVLLDRTSFYGEAGGQVGDTGWLLSDLGRLRVTDTVKYNQNFIVHKGRLEEGAISAGDQVEARVEEEKRKATERNHSATHLLHGALREILGDHVKQAGSLVTPERLRFDFSHFTQVSQERLKEVEALVNRRIRENLPVTTQEMPREAAMKTGAMAIFEERYGDRVRLVQVGNGLSMELCGGTHTTRTGDIGLFKIISEAAVGANLRRIEALTGGAALDYVQKKDDELRSIVLSLKTSADQVGEKIARLLKEQKEREREIESLKARLLSKRSGDLLSGVREIKGVSVLVQEMEADSPGDLREFADRVKERLKSGIIVLGAKKAGKAMLICVITKDLIDRFKADEIIGRLAIMVGGKGGGRADMAQGGGGKVDELERALKSVYEWIEKKA